MARGRGITAGRIVAALLCTGTVLAPVSRASNRPLPEQPVSAESQPSARPAAPPASPCGAPAETAPRTIRVGECIRSTLDESDPALERDPALEGQIRYEEYRLTLRAHEAVRIDMDAVPSPTAAAGTGFDTYLELRRAGEAQPVRANDDRTDQPGSLNSTIIFDPPEDGEYIVRARSLWTRGGDFTLRVSAMPASSVRTLELGGEAIVSTLEVNDPEAAGRRYEEYDLRLRRGDIVQIDMEATVAQAPVGTQRLDPYLTVSSGGMARPFITNDDRGDSLDARLSFIAPANDTYRVRAEGLDRTAGQYRLRATRITRLPEVEMLAGDRGQGIWRDGSPATLRDRISVRYREFRFAGAANERIQIDAASNLPMRVMVGRLDDRAWFVDRVTPGAGILPAPTNEGDPRDKQMRVFAVLPQAGEYLVRVEVPAPRRGSFELGLTRAAPTIVEPVPLDRAQSLSGTLGLNSGFDTGGSGGMGRLSSLYQLYSLPVRAGERLVISLQSEDFDPVLEAGAMSVIGFAAAAYNDDDEEGLNARLELNIAEDGILYLRARSNGPRVGQGRFRLQVTPAAGSGAPSS